MATYETPHETRLRELSEEWHAPACDTDSGGACILHEEEKAAWRAGWKERHKQSIAAALPMEVCHACGAATHREHLVACDACGNLRAYCCSCLDNEDPTCRLEYEH